MLTSTPNLGLILSLLALLLAIYALWQNRKINRLRKTFFAGKSGLDLEGVMLSLKEQLAESQRHQAALEAAQKHMGETLSFAVQKVGLVRFNPFADGGGNFSFSLALLDNHNNGVILTSMYGREQNRIYTKKIQGGGSDGQLTAEEMQAVAFANSKTQEPKSKKNSTRKI